MYVFSKFSPMKLTNMKDETANVVIWSAIEPGMGITAVSVAALRPLFRKVLEKTVGLSYTRLWQRRISPTIKSKREQKLSWLRQNLCMILVLIAMSPMCPGGDHVVPEAQTASPLWCEIDYAGKKSFTQDLKERSKGLRQNPQYLEV
jgi:hypothetical protein